jgi:hypothetical protein
LGLCRPATIDVLMNNGCLQTSRYLMMLLDSSS